MVQSDKMAVSRSAYWPFKQYGMKNWIIYLKRCLLCIIHVSTNRSPQKIIFYLQTKDPIFYLNANFIDRYLQCCCWACRNACVGTPNTNGTYNTATQTAPPQLTGCEQKKMHLALWMQLWTSKLQQDLAPRYILRSWAHRCIKGVDLLLDAALLNRRAGNKIKKMKSCNNKAKQSCSVLSTFRMFVVYIGDVIFKVWRQEG